MFYYISSTKEVYSSNDEQKYIAQTDKQEIKQEKTVEEEKIIIHIAGEVKRNGIVEVKKNARLYDVIEAAAGITDDADLSVVNLAYIVQDGQKIYIPSIEDKYQDETEKENIQNIGQIISEGPGDGIIEGETYTNNGGLININKANVSDLTLIPGIGEATALKIIEYRTVHGNFKTIEDIKNVSGIGDAKFNAIKGYICV